MHLLLSFLILWSVPSFSEDFSLIDKENSKYPHADQDLQLYDKKMAEIFAKLNGKSEDLNNKDWIVLKLANLFEADQFMRLFAPPHQKQFSADEQEYYAKEFQKRWREVDISSAEYMKKIIKIYTWVKISEFSKETDLHGWILVQHADHDVEFQKQVLPILEKLYPLKETNPANYGYLYDRIAVNEKRLQRYGTQGMCVGKNEWEPKPMENPAQVDERRATLGLSTMAEYKKLFIGICH